MNNFTASQKKAIESFQSNLCVLAGAGSGKTTILVERFLRAVTGRGVDPKRILAITFTDKAANEMKSRLVRECDRRGLARLRRDLENAYISTIHGFCARILRENPVESGIDPFFRVLGQGEAELLFARSLDRIFEEGAEDEGLLSLLKEYGEGSLRKTLKSFYDATRALGEDGLLKIHSALRKELEAAEKKIVSDLHHLLSSIDGREEGATVRRIADSAAKLARYFSDQAGRRDVSWLGRILETKKGLERKTRHKEAASALQDRIDAWAAMQTDELALPFKSDFVRLFKRFRAVIEIEKMRFGAYDFEDLLAMTYQLLSGAGPKNKAVLTGLQEHFSLVMVDEFQDTSPLQAKIIERIAGPKNLFVVGDPQQSVYGFRFAEPEVLLRFSREGGGTQTVMLDDNYRSRPEILQVINHIFSNNPAAAFRPLVAKKVFASPAEGSVEILGIPKDKGQSLEEARVKEARAIARHIHKLVKEGVFSCQDIAILFRATTASYLFESELGRLGIPHFTVKGSGFYEKPETKDLLHLLELLENPDQDIALAAVLRSPLVGIKDDTLFWLARHVKMDNPQTPLFAAVSSAEKVPHLQEDERQKLTSFRKRLEGWKSKKNKVKLSQILHEALNATDYEAKTLMQEEGRQKLANIRKLEAIAQNMERQGILGIADFIQMVKNISESEAFEPEARIQTQNAVTLMSIHAAKGLEFDCVIVADLGGKGPKGKSDAFVADAANGLGTRLRDAFTGLVLPDRSFLEIQGRRQFREEGESQRLLYVAMTRARERLILSGVVDAQMENIMTRDFTGLPVTMLTPDPEPAVGGQMAPPQSPRLDTVLGEDLEKRLKPFYRNYEIVQDLTVSDLLADACLPDRQAGKDIVMERDWQPSENEEEDGTPRNEFGTIFHHVMEQVVLRRPREVSRWPLFNILTRSLTGPERLEMRESLSRFWKGPWGEKIRQAKRVYPELPFLYRTPRGLLKGQIDLIFQGQDGRWVVLDYKTNRVTSGQIPETAKAYQLQLLLYGLVFKELYGQAPAQGVLYFSTPHEARVFDWQAGDFADFQTDLTAAFENSLHTRGLA